MTNTNFIKILIAAAALFGTFTISSSELNESFVNERVGFHIARLKIYHQYDWRNMTIAIEYEGDEENIAQVKRRTKKFLKEYTNMTDFWEVMNVSLVHTLVQEFPEIKAMQSKFSLDPDTSLFFSRASTVVYREGVSVLKESFGFIKPNYLICNKIFASLDMVVTFDLKDNPIPSDYPDYQWVDDAMMEFFADHPISSSVWEETKPLLEAYLLERFPSLKTIDVTLKVAQ